MLILDGVSGRHVISASLDVGTRWPFHVTSTGKCILAFQGEAHRERFLSEPLKPFTKNTLTDRKALEAELEGVRSRGYAAAFEELEEGYAAVAAPFRDGAGNVEGAISIGAPVGRVRRDDLDRLGARLAEVAEALTRARQA